MIGKSSIYFFDDVIKSKYIYFSTYWKCITYCMENSQIEFATCQLLKKELWVKIGNSWHFCSKMTFSTCTALLIPGNTEYEYNKWTSLSRTRNIHPTRLQILWWLKNLIESWIYSAPWSWLAFWLPPLMEHTAIW